MYAHRKNIIQSYEKLDKDIVLHHEDSVEFGFKGEYVATNIDKDQFIISDEYVKAMKEVFEVKANKNKKSESPFVTEHIQEMVLGKKVDKELMSKAYVEMGDINSDISTEAFQAENEAIRPEDESYISGERLGWNKED